MLLLLFLFNLFVLAHNLECQSLAGYYVGVFQNSYRPALNYTLQFQISLDANQADQRVYAVIDHWNQTYANSKDFDIDIYYSGVRSECRDMSKNCSGPFAHKDTDFTFDLNHQPGNPDNFFHILYFEYFNNSFVLDNPIGKCTKNQSNLNDNWKPNSSLYDYCICCGGYQPSEESGCPANPWIEPPQSTTTKPPPASTSCQSIVGYYNGTFKNRGYPNLIYTAQFQFRLTSNLTAQQYQLVVEGWNETVSSSSNFSMDYYYDYAEWCDIIVNKTCSSPFGQRDNYFALDFNHGTDEDTANVSFNLLWFSYGFNRTFILNGTTGECTDDPPNAHDDRTPDPSLLESCMCCNDYNPDSILNCPKSPWV